MTNDDQSLVELLDELITEVQRGPLTVTFNVTERRRYWREDERELVFGKEGDGPSETVTLKPPEDGDPESMAEGLLAELDSAYHGRTFAESDYLLQVLPVVKSIQDRFNNRIMDRITEAKAEAEREERERREKEARREAELKEREERLLMEFVGDEVRARLAGYKSFTPGIVDARERYNAPGEYQVAFSCPPWFTRDWRRISDLSRVRRMDVKQGSRFITLWDDGKDDLPQWERSKVREPRAWKEGW